MTAFRLDIVFSGVDFDDDEVFEALADLPDITWRAQGSFAFATAMIEAPSAVEAANLVTQQVVRRVPSATPIRLDEDLVAISDIASRVGVTREAVRHWANGTRHSNFPLPRGIVGDGIKVWAWSDVNGWLRENLNLGDPEEFPSAHDAALINAMFASVPRRRLVSAAASSPWNVIRTLSMSAETRLPGHASRQAEWVGRRCHQVWSPVVDEEHVAV
jgi:hypothetical protein